MTKTVSGNVLKSWQTYALKSYEQTEIFVEKIFNFFYNNAGGLAALINMFSGTTRILLNHMKVLRNANMEINL